MHNQYRKTALQLILSALFVLLLFLPLQATDSTDVTTDYRQTQIRNCWEMVRLSWDARSLPVDRPLTIAEEKTAATFANSMRLLENSLLRTVVEALVLHNTEPLNQLNQFVINRPIPEREAFNSLYHRLETFHNSRRLQKETVHIPDDTYIPGHGWTDNDYIYARTDTVETRIIGQYWQERWHHMVINEAFKGTAAVSIVPALKQNANNLVLKGEPYTLVYNEGEVLDVQQLSFTTKGYHRFKNLRLYAIRRTDFELYRAPKDYLFTPKWERIDNTYELSEEILPDMILTEY